MFKDKVDVSCATGELFCLSYSVFNFGMFRSWGKCSTKSCAETLAEYLTAERITEPLGTSRNGFWGCSECGTDNCNNAENTAAVECRDAHLKALDEGNYGFACTPTGPADGGVGSTTMAASDAAAAGDAADATTTMAMAANTTMAANTNSTADATTTMAAVTATKTADGAVQSTLRAAACLAVLVPVLVV